MLRAFKPGDVLSVLPDRAVGLRNHDGSSLQFDADPLGRPSGGHSGRAWLAATWARWRLGFGRAVRLWFPMQRFTNPKDENTSRRDL